VLTVAGTNVLTGANSLVVGSGQVNGSGTVILTGAQNYTGVTTINAGKLSLTTGSIPGGNVNINNGGTLGLNSAANITGATSVIVNQGGVLSIDTSFASEGSLIDSSSTGIVAINTSSDSNLTGVNGSSAFIGVLGVTGAAGVTGNSFTLASSTLASGAGNIYRLAGLGVNVGSGAQATSVAGILTVSNGVLTDAGGAGASLIIGTAQTTASGTVVLAAANSFTGGTTINSGTLQLNVQGAWGTGNIADYDTLAFNNSSAISFSQIISGTGALNEIGSGITTLNSVNTLSGTTTISSGAIKLGVSNALGNSVVSIGVNSSSTTGLLFATGIGNFSIAGLSGSKNEALTDLGSTAVTLNITGNGLTNTFSGNLTGLGSLNINTTGTQILTGTANTYGGGTTITNGTLQVGSGANAGSLPTTGTITDNGALVFNNNSTTTAVTVSAPITGSGTLTQAGTTTTTLTGAESYTGGTTIAAGTLQIGTGGSLPTTGGIATSFTPVGGVTTSGTLAFNNSSGMTVATVITGSGNVTQLAGTTILTAASNYSGGTTITAGALQLGDGTLNNGSVTGAITNNASLVIADPNSQSVDNTISGTGALTKTGSGAATLTAANSYTGPTTINQGTLSISADNNLGTVSTPTVGQLTLNGGTLKTTSTFALSANRGLSVGSNGGTINTDPLPVSFTLTIPGQTNFATDAHLNIGVAGQNSYVKFTNTANAANVGTNATVTVAAGSTLELAGTGSALSDGTTAHGVNVVNNSTAAAGGLYDSSTSPQIVGPISGSGNTVVGASANLTAGSIIQNSLDIGNGALFTLGTSDSNGNPLAQTSSLLGGDSLAGGSNFTSLAGSAGLNATGASGSAPTLGLGGAGSGVSAVPEPSSIILTVMAGLGLAAMIRRRSRKV
jgi:fibronectin-binding autotransporter adhesin